MSGQPRWTPCIVHAGDEVNHFLSSYFAGPEKKIFLMTGAGFDPRACSVTGMLTSTQASVRALLIREERPDPPQRQLDRARENTRLLVGLLSESRVKPVEIFGTDNAVVGGRAVVGVLAQQYLDDITDIVIDMSALSVGTSFPIVHYFVQGVGGGIKSRNLHLFISHSPRVDAGIHSIECDSPSYIHGFKGRATLSETADAARLWLPQLASGRRAALERLYNFVAPHDICPIIPFPASDPRLGDVLAEEYLDEFESIWSVDARNIVYAHEEDPLDLYRTILRLDDLRKPVFEGAGGSKIVLSPLGGKVMALGALLAALERNLPVAHLESIGYMVDESVMAEVERPNLIHLWLEGDVYPSSRPTLAL